MINLNILIDDFVFIELYDFLKKMILDPFC